MLLVQYKSRLVKTYLDKDIVPSKSSFRVKKNRVTISLWKADKNHSWMNLTEKNPGKSLKPNASDPSAGIMDMMKVRCYHCGVTTLLLLFYMALLTCCVY